MSKIVTRSLRAIGKGIGPALQRGSLKEIFGKPNALELHIMDKTVSIQDLAGFQSYLEHKTGVPAERLPVMLEMSDTELQGEIDMLAGVEQAITKKLQAADRQPEIIERYLSDSTLTRFSQDHDWRQIIFELSSKEPGLNEFKKLAVHNYLKYIQARLSTLQTIQGNRQKHPAHNVSGSEQSDTVYTAAVFASTAKFTANKPVSNLGNTRFTRLQRGEPTVLTIKDRHEVTIQMASKLFTLNLLGTPTLLCSDGKGIPLNVGENLIGRNYDCSIKLGEEYSDVSRHHCTIELLGDHQLRIVDLSSQGTYLPAELF